MIKSTSQLSFISPKKESPQKKSENAEFDMEKASEYVQKYSDSPIIKRFQNY